MHFSAAAASPAVAPARRATVSVVIPVKDDAGLLARCLRALRAQSELPDEIVVVDNGSSDRSAAVARRMGAVAVHCPVPGIPAAASTGYDAASGDLILRLDADCVPDPRWVGAMIRAFDDHPEIDAFTGGAVFIDGPRVLRRPLATFYLGAYHLVCRTALGHRPLFGSNLAMRRSAWEAVSPEVHRGDSELHDDLDLSFHLGLRHRIGTLDGAGMGMSMRPFASGSGMRRRVRRGMRTVTSHWPTQFPPHRWRRVRAHRRGRDTSELPAHTEFAPETV
jgi:glycosyltransferase involved in cell wall biosynthesis